MCTKFHLPTDIAPMPENINHSHIALDHSSERYANVLFIDGRRT